MINAVRGGDGRAVAVAMHDIAIDLIVHDSGQQKMHGRFKLRLLNILALAGAAAGNQGAQ